MMSNVCYTKLFYIFNRYNPYFHFYSIIFIDYIFPLLIFYIFDYTFFEQYCSLQKLYKSSYNLRKISWKKNNNFVRGSIHVFAIDRLADPEIIAGRYGNKRADIRQWFSQGWARGLARQMVKRWYLARQMGGRKIAVKRPPSIINPGAIRLSINSLVPRIFREIKRNTLPVKSYSFPRWVSAILDFIFSSRSSFSIEKWIIHAKKLHVTYNKKGSDDLIYWNGERIFRNGRMLLLPVRYSRYFVFLSLHYRGTV